MDNLESHSSIISTLVQTQWGNTSNLVVIIPWYELLYNAISQDLITRLELKL